MDIQDFYLANPDEIPYELEQQQQRRAQMVELANMYRQSGMGAEYMNAVIQIRELDNNTTLTLGSAGLMELQNMNDPRRLASVWSLYARVPVGIQPRDNGNWDIIINGRRTAENQTTAEVARRAQLVYSAAYREQEAATAAEYNKMLFESQLKMNEIGAQGDVNIREAQAKQPLELEQIFAKETAQALREFPLASFEAQADMELEFAKRNVRVNPLGDGTFTVSTPDQRVFLYNANPEPSLINGIEVAGQRLVEVYGGLYQSAQE
jgi:hypothetical protein